MEKTWMETVVWMDGVKIAFNDKCISVDEVKTASIWERFFLLMIQLFKFLIVMYTFLMELILS